MLKDLILITGVSGFIGFKILTLTLEAGYRVRGVVRKQDQISDIKNALPNQELSEFAEFVVLTDLTAPHAFDSVMDGVSYVIHVASPMVRLSDNYERDMFGPAINLVLNVLSAAVKTATIKRIIVTSSVAALVPVWEFAEGRLTKEVILPDDELSHYDLDTQFPHPLLAYAASKAISLNAAENFLKAENLHFDVIFIMPALTIGASALWKSTQDVLLSTNRPVMNLLLGGLVDGISGASISVDDVAKLHVLALNPNIPAGRYLASTGGKGGRVWSDAFDIVKRNFPKAFGTIFATEGNPTVTPLNVDTSKTEKTFGFTFESFEEQVKSVAGQYLALLEKETKQ